MHDDNSFDILRLVGALMVFWGHAYILTGHDGPQFGGLAIETLGVCVFFAISGYLITQSWLADPNLRRYLWKRSLRIFPALVVTVAATALLIGPVMSTEPLGTYFSHRWVYYYLVANCLLITVWSLPGLFVSAPIAGQANGSLWTLPIEFLLYLATPLLMVAGRAIPRATAGGLVVLAVALPLARASFPALATFNLAGVDLGKGLELVPYFLCGAAFRLAGFGRWRPARRELAGLGCVALLTVGMAVTVEAATWRALAVVPIATVVLALGLGARLSINPLKQVGDLSYGVYLWAFPIQQSMYQLTGSGPLANMAQSLPIVLSLAFASWWLIEKRALRLKSGRRPADLVARSGAWGRADRA